LSASALVTAWDVLAVAGECATLELEVERLRCAFWDPPLEGADVEVEGLGSATTDARGRAELPLGPLGPGTYRYRVRLRSTRWEASPAEALVCAVPRETPVFVTDIDRTIADISPLGFILLGNDLVRPMPGAPEALREIARRFQVVYLTARDHVFAAKTRDWLRRRGFPESPLYLRKGTRFWDTSPRDHKIARLGELRARFPRLRWGVGDVRGDLEAYAAHGIEGILLSPRGRPVAAPGRVARSWTEILTVVLDRAPSQ
jgi:phosphatidate phosphatase APP1